MALGEALMEDQHFRKGLHKMPSILDYKIPTFLEIPDIESIIIETEEPAGPYGAKEAGQGAQLPVIPALANAIYDAVGVRIDETPITSEKIFVAMQRKNRGQSARVGPCQWPVVDYPKPLLVPSRWGERVPNAQTEGERADSATSTV